MKLSTGIFYTFLEATSVLAHNTITPALGVQGKTPPDSHRAASSGGTEIRTTQPLRGNSLNVHGIDFNTGYTGPRVFHVELYKGIGDRSTPRRGNSLPHKREEGGLLEARSPGVLTRASKVKSQSPKVEKQEKKKTPKGRAKKRILYNPRFTKISTASGGKGQMNPTAET